jgi:hypothetical protein
LDLFAQGQYSEAATAARQLHHLGDLLDLNPALDGIQIMGTVPSVARKMAQDYGAVLDVTGNLRLTRLQALDLRDAIGASLPVKDATTYIGTLDNAMGYEASAVKALYDGAHITGSYTGSIVMHIGVYPTAAKYDVRLNEEAKVLRMDAVDWGTTTPTANDRLASDLAALRFMAEQPGFDTVWIEAVDGLRWDVRDLLLAKGGQMKAERIVIRRT